MTDTDDTTEAAASARPSIALTTPFLSLAAAVIALAAFLLGYVVKDLGDEHRRPEFGIARFQGGPGGIERGRGEFGPGGPGQALPARPGKGLEKVAAGTVKSVDGNTITIEGPNGKSTKVTLDTKSFIVVRTSTKK